MRVVINCYGDNGCTAQGQANRPAHAASGHVAGFQQALIEYARYALGFVDAESSEDDPDVPFLSSPKRLL